MVNVPVLVAPEPIILLRDASVCVVVVDLDHRALRDAVNVLDDAAFNGDNDFLSLHVFLAL